MAISEFIGIQLKSTYPLGQYDRDWGISELNPIQIIATWELVTQNMHKETVELCFNLTGDCFALLV